MKTKNLVLAPGMSLAVTSYSRSYGKVVNVCFGVLGSIPANTLTHIATIDDSGHYPWLDINLAVVDRYGNSGFGTIAFSSGKIMVRFPIDVETARGCVTYIKA